MLVLISRIFPSIPEYSHRAVSEPAFTMFTVNCLGYLISHTIIYSHKTAWLAVMLLHETERLLSTGLLGIHKESNNGDDFGNGKFIFPQT
jgi:hypothetical protein